MKGFLVFAAFFLVMVSLLTSQENAAVNYIEISVQTDKKSYFQGEEGFIKIRITPRSDINISVYPEMLIRFKPNANLVYAKIFFNASELDYLTRQEKDTDFVYYNLDKEISIPFKVSETALLGRMSIEGEVAYSAVFVSNHWCLKTFQPFEAEIISKFKRKAN